MRLRNTLPALAVTTSLLLSMGMVGCGASSGGNDSEEPVTVEQPNEQAEDEGEASAIPDASEIQQEAVESSEGDVESDTADTIPDDSGGQSASTEDLGLSDRQLNSMAMLNYLAVVSEDISASKNSRLKLEETYSTLINNTYPNAIDDRTLAQLESLLDTLEGYRMVAVKRDRLEYIYEQNQAQAMRAAMPNPLGLLSAVESGNLVQLAASVAYMAVDSYTSYQSSSSAAQLEYLKSGWELDDEEASLLHERRKDTFSYMVRTVSDYDLPGYLALNEESVEQLVDWSSNSNVARRIRFLESNQETYRAYGGYWLILSGSYYENGDYDKCLGALATYEGMGAGILRKDFDYAKSIPAAIVAASSTMGDDEYAEYAEKHVSALVENCNNTDWELLYFAAQTYVDLYRRTSKAGYLQRAYDIALDNVNFLVDKQDELNTTYLDPVREAKNPDGATKEQKKEVKQYNKMVKDERKKALPPAYQPLLVNCDLLFALADELDISEPERTNIDKMLHPGGDAIFLTRTLDERYRFAELDEETNKVAIEFNGTKLVIPAEMVSAETMIAATVGKEELPGTWMVTKVDRGGSSDVSSFKATYENKDAKGSYKDGDIVTFTFVDGGGDATVASELKFKASVNERWGVIPDDVSFEQVDK